METFSNSRINPTSRASSRVSTAASRVGTVVKSIKEAISEFTGRAASRVVRSRAPSRAPSRAASIAPSRVASDNLDKTDGRIRRKRLSKMKPLPQQQYQKDTVGVKQLTELKKLPSIILLDWKEISSILNNPFEKIPDDIMRSLLFKSSFTDNYEENIKLLKEHIARYKRGIYKDYHKHIAEIRTHLDEYDYYEIINEKENEDSTKFYEKLKSVLSSYDPLNITVKQLEELKQILFSKKCMDLYDGIIICEFREAILHTTDEKVTKSTLKKKLKKMVITYRVLLFISNIINQHYSSPSSHFAYHYLHESNQNSIKNTELINILANKHNYILINNIKIDIVNILESSIDNSSLDSKTDISKKGERSRERRNLLEYLKNNQGYKNSINDEDFITLEKWEDMTLKQLRRVIKISYELKTRNDETHSFCYAFDSKGLYNLFLTNDWINPYSRQEFSEKDIIAVFAAFGKRDFRKDKGDYGTVINTRYDVELTIVPLKEDTQYKEITILYLVDKGIVKYESDSFKIRLARITIKEMPGVDILINKIRVLYDDNKIISTMIPFTFHPAFVEYNGKTIDETNMSDFAAMID
jgi:hypothetical protein